MRFGLLGFHLGLSRFSNGFTPPAGALCPVAQGRNSGGFGAFRQRHESDGAGGAARFGRAVKSALALHSPLGFKSFCGFAVGAARFHHHHESGLGHTQN